MTSFISAGHNLYGVKDPGAGANGRVEAVETIRLRDLVLKAMALRHPDIKVIADKDNERLGEYLARIQAGNGSVVLEFHLDAASDPKATGTTAIVANNASKNSIDFGTELVNSTSIIFGIKNRGVKPESYAAVGRLGLMRKAGIVVLLEVGFITNPKDMEALDDECKARIWADQVADITAKFDNLIK